MATSSHLPSAAQHSKRRLALPFLAVVTALSVGASRTDDSAAGATNAQPTCAGAPASATVALARTAIPQVRTLASAAPNAGSYDWPLKPFNRQHPVRAFFDDPRIGRRERVFHFGIDIAAPDRTA